MNNTNENDRVLGCQIAEHLRDRDAARNDKTPLPVPVAMTDPKVTPEQKTIAEEAYAAALLNRQSITADEQKWLSSRIAACFREMISSGERK